MFSVSGIVLVDITLSF